MAISAAFYEAVKSGDVIRVRIMMKDSLLIDPTFVDFHAMEKAAGSMPGLYDAHDGKELVTDRALWNDEYMDRVMVKVVSNFSHERIKHLKEVVGYLRPVAKPTVSETDAKFTPSERKQQQGNRSYESKKESNYQKQKRIDKESGNYHRIEKVGTGVVVGGVFGGVAAAVAGAPTVFVIGTAAAGAIIGGIAVATIDGGKQ